MGIISVLFGIVFASAPSLVVSLGEVEVDWSLGTMMAPGAAAADIRMPGPHASRPKAERQAIAFADAKLRAALQSLAELPGETLTISKIASLMALAATERVEYQSNGGVVLWRKIPFAHHPLTSKQNPTPVALRVRSMPFRLAPVITFSNQQVATPYAIYRRTNAPEHALNARWNTSTGLILDRSATRHLKAFETAGVEIYIEGHEP